MSDTDRFIDEVTEEVRRDRLFALMRRWGWLAILVVLLIVGGASWYEWQKNRRHLTAAQAGDELLAALSLPEAEARIAGLVAADEKGPVPALLIAGQEQAAGDVPAAIAAYDAIAADGTVPQLYRDMAALRSLILQAGVTPPADRIAALQQLALPGATFAPLAQEQIALAQIEAGDLDAARAMLTTITSDAATPQSLGARAAALLQALGTGEAPEAAPAEEATEPVTEAAEPATEPAAEPATDTADPAAAPAADTTEPAQD